MFIADPRSGFFSIPDPGDIKAPDTGSLKTENTYGEDEAVLNNVHYDQKKKM
jgi:hypothetical protein